MGYRSRPVRAEFAYGGVPEDMAYGMARGGRLVGAPKKNSIFGNTENEAEDGEHHETVRETLERVFNDVNAREQNKEYTVTDDRTFGSDYFQPLTAAAADGKASDDELVDRMYETIKDHEGFKNSPYYDTKWNKTVGAGLNVENRSAFNNLNWTYNNQPATQEQIDDCWNSLENEKKRLQSTSDTPNINNYSAEHFENFCDISLSDDDIIKDYKKHMLADLPVIRNLIPNFDTMKTNEQDGIMDMMYSLGGDRFGEFTNFIKAAKKNDVAGMMEQCHRRGIDEERNNWTRDMFAKSLKK